MVADKTRGRPAKLQMGEAYELRDQVIHRDQKAVTICVCVELTNLMLEHREHSLTEKRKYMFCLQVYLLFAKRCLQVNTEDIKQSKCSLYEHPTGVPVALMHHLWTPCVLHSCTLSKGAND